MSLAWSTEIDFHAPPLGETLENILGMLLRLSPHVDATPSDLSTSPLVTTMKDMVRAGTRPRFLLPAFPAKSPNPRKTSGSLPDLGEVLGLRALEYLCREIDTIYAPGADVLVASDGRVFNDLVLVPDEDVRDYQHEIRRLIERDRLDHVKTFSLDECWPGSDMDFPALRAHLVANYAAAEDDLRSRIRTDAGARAMFNGIHRFVTEDRRALFPERSRNSLSLESHRVALDVIRRSQAWDRLLEERFPSVLRLSIHPYPLNHRKFGIVLVPGEDRWATPWHNVTVKTARGFRLMKREAAERLGALPRRTEDGDVFFEV